MHLDKDYVFADMENRIGISGNVAVEQHAPIPVTLPELGCTVFESRHAPGFAMAVGEWPFHKICWIECGRGFLRTESDRRRLGQDSLVFVREGVRHAFEDRKGDPMTLYMVCFSDAFVTSGGVLSRTWAEFRSAIASTPILLVRDPVQQRQLVQRFRRMIFEQTRREVGADALIVAHLLNLLVYLTRTLLGEPTSPPASGLRGAVAEVRLYLDSNFFQPLQIPELARMAGCSPRRFTTLFKEQTGCTVNRYINNRRVEYARERIEETGNITASAFEAGFEDLSHFYRVFKQCLGTTPGAFTPRNSR